MKLTFPQIIITPDQRQIPLEPHEYLRSNGAVLSPSWRSRGNTPPSPASDLFDERLSSTRVWHVRQRLMPLTTWCFSAFIVGESQYSSQEQKKDVCQSPLYRKRLSAP